MISNGNLERVFRSIPNFLWPIKTILLKYSVRHGKNFKVGPNVILYNYRQITIGDNVFIGDKSTFGGNVPISIGNNVMFGPEVMIRGGDHNISAVGEPMVKVKTGGVNLPIIIEDDIWIGTRVIILKGVKIGEGSVVGAGAIVTKDIPPYTINIGSPSRPIKCRFSQNQLSLHLQKVNSKYSLYEILKIYAKLNVKIINEEK